MANTKISALTSATTPLAGTEVLPIVQSSATVKVAVSDLTAGRSISVSGLTNTGLTASKPVFTDASKLLTSTGVVPVANGGTNASAAGIAAFNNITGYTASGATGTTSTNLVFSTSPTLVTPTLGAALATSIKFGSGSVLSSYEEGTWTPTLIGTTTNPTVTYGLQRGVYTKVGRIVTVSVYLTWSAFSGGSGNVAFGNLPFTIESGTGASAAGSISLFDGFTLTAGRTSVGLLGASNTTYGLPSCSGSGVTSQYIGVGSVAASGAVQYTLTYSV